VDIPNAFIGKPKQPTPTEVAAALGVAAPAWNELLNWFAQEKAVTGQEWKCYSLKYGWSLQLKLKRRTIVHLSPCSGCFRAAFILGDKAVKVARGSNLSAKMLKLIDEAPRYPEGTGIRLIVHSEKDLAPIRKLAAIKLAN
jgi:hypothetical protein